MAYSYVYIPLQYMHKPACFEISLPQYAVQLKIVYGTEEDPPLDVSLMEEADAFIANCVSAFSAVAKRERDHLGKRTDFWGFL